MVQPETERMEYSKIEEREKHSGSEALIFSEEE